MVFWRTGNSVAGIIRDSIIFDSYSEIYEQLFLSVNNSANYCCFLSCRFRPLEDRHLILLIFGYAV